MKKIVIVYAIAAFIASSCTGMQEAPEISGVPMVLTAYQEGTPDTRTAVENGGKQVFWEPGDEIKVFSGSRSGKFTSSAESLEAVTTFTGHLEGNEPDVADIWAVYPYSDEASFDGECITTVIPSVQVARPGTFAQGANVAIAHSTTTSLQFYNVGGGIRFSLTEEGVKKVIFEGLGGEVISGTVKVGFEDGLPKVKEVSGGSMFITLTPPDGGSFTVGEWYYLTAIPGALNSGFKLRFYKDDDTYAKLVSEKAYTVKRHIFGSVQNINMEYEFVTTHFPETAEEILESVEMTNEIGESLSSILDNNDLYAEDGLNVILSEASEIEGVLEAVVNDPKTTLSIKQADGIWLNVYLDVNQTLAKSITQGSQFPAYTTSTKRIKSPYYSKDNNSKLALLLAPYQDIFRYNIDEIKNDLMSIGYMEENIHYFQGSEADIEKFKGSNLCKYSFILIMTHGGTGYLAKSLNGQAVYNQTTLSSGTVYSPRKALTMVIDEKLDLSTVAISSPDNGKTWHFDMTPAFLGDVSFDNSCILLAACNSAQIITPGEGNGSMIWHFINCGATAVAGFKESIQGDVCNPTMEFVVKLMANGATFNEAYDCVVQSDITTTMCNKAFYAYHNWDESYTYAPFDVTSSFYHEQNDDDLQYYMEKPSVELSHDIDGYHATLSWTSNLYDFNFYWPYYSSKDDTNVYGVYYPATYHVEYDVYINDNPPVSCHDNSFEFDVSFHSEYKWYVVAKRMEGNRIIASYVSHIDEFTIHDSNPPISGVPEAIDLGLPSGLKWASMNVGATKPEEYGDYFAWGETEPKDKYNWSTYIWCTGEQGKYIKYCPIEQSQFWNATGNPDGKTTLELEDDAAHVHWGGSWRMPTYEEFQELVGNCDIVLTSEKGIDGFRCTSKVPGFTDKSIFLPAAGSRIGSSMPIYSSPACNFWSSSLYSYNPRDAYILYIHSGSLGWTTSRDEGLTIRPVTK